MGGGGSALRVCADHRGGINWLSLSPDGQRLLTGSEDGTARLWSTADGQCCALLQGHESYVTFCQLEDEAAFTCSADCTIRKWDVRTGQCLQVFRGHTSIVNRILVANNQLFSSSYDRTARAWSVDKGQVSQEFRGHRNCVLTLAYSAPWDLPGAPCAEEVGGLLVTGSTDGTAKHRRHHPCLGHPEWGAAAGVQGAPGLRHLSGARQPARVLGQRRQDGQVLAGRHGRARAHVCGPQTQRERPQIPRRHFVHGQRGRPRARLRRPVWSAAEGVPRPRLRHQLHPGARAGALHGLARRRAAPLGRARPPVRPAAAPRRPRAEPLPPLQQQGGLRRRAPAAGLSPGTPPPALALGPPTPPPAERAPPHSGLHLAPRDPPDPGSAAPHPRAWGPQEPSLP
uniref:WD repeat domain 86 n=1 Tax=Canis lupus dingo TaxID=286419 RepID=A0A8C0JY35_CANLU